MIQVSLTGYSSPGNFGKTAKIPWNLRHDFSSSNSVKRETSYFMEGKLTLAMLFLLLLLFVNIFMY